MSKSRDGIRDFQPPAPAIEPPGEAVQPEAVAPAADMDLKTAVASMALAIGELAKGQKAQNTVISTLVNDREQFLAREREDIARNERFKKESEKSIDVRTQERADKLWPSAPGMKRYQCTLLYVNERTGKKVVDRAFPSVEVNAHSEDEAQAHFLKVAGITNTEGEVKLALVGKKNQEPVADEQPEEYLPTGVMALS